jgi:hypothetical protein
MSKMLVIIAALATIVIGANMVLQPVFKASATSVPAVECGPNCD